MEHCLRRASVTSGHNSTMEEQSHCRCGRTLATSNSTCLKNYSQNCYQRSTSDVRPHQYVLRCSCQKGSWWHTGQRTSCNIKHHSMSDIMSSSVTSTICLVLCVLLLVAGSATAQDGLRYTVTEDGESGVFIGDVFQDADLFSKFDGNDEVLSQLRFRFLRSDHGNFVIDERTGVIRTAGSIDRESVDLQCMNKDICDMKLDVVVQPVQYFQIIKATVEILDVNDHYPEFSDRRVIHSVPESTLPDSSLLTLNVQDVDSPKNSIQRFELLPASNTMFRVTSSSQIDGSIEIKLKLQEALDRESINEHNLRIVAYDGGNPAKTGSVDVQLIIMDANDNSPTFESPSYEVSIPEDISVPQSIITVHASDPDSGSNGEIVYGFAPSTVKNYGGMFDIDDTTGDIRVISTPEYGDTSVYTLGVTAMDKGPFATSADAKVVVTVMDVNDHAPEIAISTLATEGSENAVVPENAKLGTFVSHLSVSDQDSGDNAVVSCYLDSSHFSLEFLYDNEYQMLTLTQFDREALNQYSVKIICRDRGTPPLSSETTVIVDVSDVNDNAPEFEQNIYNAELLENSFEGAVATKVHAIDFDSGVNADIVYSISDSVKNLFSINPVTGEIQAKVGIDREQVKKFNFDVYAMDEGTPARSAVANVIIHIQDVNDERPVFNQPNYSFGVFENEDAGTEVGILQAQDADDFPFNQFTYRFSQLNDAFFLDPNSGRITTRRVLDREEQSVYHLIAEAVDDGMLSHGSSTVSLSIYIADHNDNFPSLVFPNQVNNTVYVAKDVPYGYIVTRLNAIDNDIGNNARITYGIASGNDDESFDIDLDRGTILVNKDFDELEDVSFLLNVTAQDNGVPSYMAWAMLTITVNGTMILQPPPTVSPLALGGNNLVIVIALASTSGVITIILVMAIICIRRQDRNRDQSNGKYNCRMEALKFIDITKRKKLVGGSTSSGSTSNGSDNGDSINKSKKEVSFSVEMEENGDLSQDKSRKSWCSVIDHQTLQTPRACSSLLNANSSLSSAALVANGNIHNHHSHHDNHRGIYAHNGTNGHLRNLPTTQREIEIQQLLEMLKRDQDSSSLTSGEGSNTDSGRGASEEGEPGSRSSSIYPDRHSAGVSHKYLAPVPEDSYSNQVVPSSFCDSSLSFLHNTTVGSYLPSEQLRAASRNSQQSQRPLSSVSTHHSQQSVKPDSTILEMSEGSNMDNAFYDDSPLKRSPRLKSILKAAVKSPDLEHVTPLAQQGIDNYIKSRGGKYRKSDSSEMSELESEIANSELKYSCADMSDILHSKMCGDVSEYTHGLHGKVPHSLDGDDDDSSTSGSYVVDPKELCDEIDELFFKNMA